ncbi:hypothetical protein SRABI106_03969 [Rahnella aquatilis]|nr:hypothetical protein SRABI106_03969 [Rahnella aquatilis]
MSAQKKLLLVSKVWGNVIKFMKNPGIASYKYFFVVAKTSLENFGHYGMFPLKYAKGKL